MTVASDSKSLRCGQSPSRALQGRFDCGSCRLMLASRCAPVMWDIAHALPAHALPASEGDAFYGEYWTLQTLPLPSWFLNTGPSNGSALHRFHTEPGSCACYNAYTTTTRSIETCQLILSKPSTIWTFLAFGMVPEPCLLVILLKEDT